MLFAVGFLLCAALIHGFLHAAFGDPVRLYANERSEKFALMDRYRGKTFSAFFGSSHVTYGLDPRVFDRALAGTDLATSSVNLAVRGGSQTEQLRVAMEWAKQLESPRQAGAPPQPCLAILEMAMVPNLGDADIVHPRAVNIYDWPTTSLVLKATDKSFSLPRRASRVVLAFTEMAFHYANLGMLSNFIFRPPLSQELLAEESRDDQRGAIAEAPSASVSPEVAALLASAPAHPQVVDDPLPSSHAAAVATIERASSVHNLTPVFVVMPTLDDTHVMHLYPDHLMVNGKAVPILNMARPDLYPELYAGRNWFDGPHLNARGAEMFTRLFAHSLRQWYASAGKPAPCNS
jgi:hypothetical protein